MSHSPALPIAITMGDPAGIGPEIVVQAFRQQPAWSQRLKSSLVFSV